MCKMRAAVSRLMLGSRELGWEIWSGKDVMEMTAKQIKDTIMAGNKVCGLTIGKDGALELDKEGFFTTDMTVHSHIGNYRTMREDSVVNLLYVCVGSHEEAGKTVYDCISSRFEQAKLTEEDMRAYLKIGIVSGGAKLDGEKIILASLEFEKKESEKPVETKLEVKEPEKPVAATEAKGAEVTKVAEKSQAVQTPPQEKISSVQKSADKAEAKSAGNQKK